MHRRDRWGWLLFSLPAVPRALRRVGLVADEQDDPHHPLGCEDQRLEQQDAHHEALQDRPYPLGLCWCSHAG